MKETLMVINTSFRVCVCVCVCVTGSCHCGRCICSPQDWWVSGEYCECDDRDCDKHDGLICTGNIRGEQRLEVLLL